MRTNHASKFPSHLTSTDTCSYAWCLLPDQLAGRTECSPPWLSSGTLWHFASCSRSQSYHLFPQSAPTTQTHACPWTECCFPPVLSSYCHVLTYSNMFSVFLVPFALIMFCHSHNFWLVTPILLGHQLPLSTVAPSGHATILHTSWYWVLLHCLFSLYIAELFIFLHRTWFQ